VFEELGRDFSLLAFDAEERVVSTFEEAARARRVPLRVIRDAYGDGRKDYEARLILVRPDRYVAWAADCTPDDAGTVIARAVGAA
jgi:hypothetical protein